MLIAVAILAFALGAAVGALLAVRNTHRIVARLPGPERVAFARKVNARIR